MRTQFYLFLLIFCSFLTNSSLIANKHYIFSPDPIDVVIPCTDKDVCNLELCIAGIKKNCSQIRRIIVVSSRPLTNNAEWFNEVNYPFSKKETALWLLKGNEEAATNFMLSASSRLGWYYQQLLKLYAPFVIPGISSNVLILDSDSVFLNPIGFLNENSEAFYNPSTEYHEPYFSHANRLLPGLHRLYPEYSGISHHMLFQRAVLEDLFSLVESHHQIPLWQAFCYSVDLKNLSASGASEYEIYFNFIFSRTNQAHMRQLKWLNTNRIDRIDKFRSKGYHYVSFHTWLK